MSSSNIILSVDEIKKTFPECVVCYDKLEKPNLPCCKKALCGNCVKSLDWENEERKLKKCPHCRTEFYIRIENKTVKQCAFKNFAYRVLVVSYLFLSFLSLLISISEFNEDKVKEFTIVDNVVFGISVNAGIMVWFFHDIKEKDEEFGQMISMKYGVPPMAGIHAVKLIAYLIKPSFGFLETYIFAYILVIGTPFLCYLIKNCMTDVFYFLSFFPLALIKIFCNCRKEVTVQVEIPQIIVDV